MKNIAILGGGNSSEYEVSLGSAANVLNALKGMDYNLYSVHVRGTEWNCVAEDGTQTVVDKNDFSTTIAGVKVKFDYALIMIHGTPGENGLMPAYFEMMGIPYSSCDSTCSMITFNKSVTKKMLRGLDVNMAREIVINRHQSVNPAEIVAQLGLPMFVKPDASGSSCGVTKVAKVEDIMPAIEHAFTESSRVLIEEFIEGREMGCGTIVTRESEMVFPVTEIVSKKDFFDYEAKYQGMSEEITPADIEESVRKELERQSLLIYKQLSCRGVVRIDFIVKKGVPYFIEINTIPGMSSQSIVPQQVAALGMTTGQLWDMVIRDTIDR